MDLFRSPWKSPRIEDPILSLSNSKLSKSKSKTIQIDRFSLNSLKKNLFGFQSQKINEYKKQNQSEILSNKQQKDLKYRSMLIRKYSKQSTKKNNSYTSKIKRPGYINNRDLINDELDIFNDSIIVQPQQKNRFISADPYRTLNAPKLKDDFYTNLVDWSNDDLISVVLNNGIYLWNLKSKTTDKIHQGPISSIKWNNGLLIGDQNGQLSIFDVHKNKICSSKKIHRGRIGTLDCLNNLIATGSKDSSISLIDQRINQIVLRHQSHRQQVCGVRLCPNSPLLASGGNDNFVSIADIRQLSSYNSNRSLTILNGHTAAVKAIAWNPHKRGILATGGGSTDKCIRIWDTTINSDNITGKCIQRIDTGSQVCNMLYSLNSQQLVSTHGYSMNAINIWKTKNMQKIATLSGHSYRVLYLALSPDGQSILTGSGDQTLKFWKVFPSSQNNNKKSKIQPKPVCLR